MKIAMKNFNVIIRNRKGGFTLIEMVMTILLIGIMSIGLYEVVMWGINDYIGSENYLHSNNSMTYAISVIRRNLENAAEPPIKLIKPRGKHYCKLKNSINPANSSEPIVLANLKNQTTVCGGTGEPPCDEVAFYKYRTTGTAKQELVVFCVNPKNNALYKEVTTTNGTTTSYPVANYISGISF